MPLELDHVFVFVDPSVPEAAALERAGFRSTPAHSHAGQGTANRSLVFGENYLELIYLASRAEAEANAMRLDRRADWAVTGHCPFGIGLRGEIPPDLRDEFWAYRPPYAHPGRPALWIYRGGERHPGLPLVFVMEPCPELPLERMRPRAWAKAHELCHAHGTAGIALVRIEVPAATGWPPGLVPAVEVAAGGQFHMTVELDAQPFLAIHAGRLLTVVARLTSTPRPSTAQGESAR